MSDSTESLRSLATNTGFGEISDAADRIDELEARLADAEQTIRDLVQELNEAKSYTHWRDARRYRWLRSCAAVETENGPWAVEWCEEMPVRDAGSTVPLIGDKLDAAVDAAMRAADSAPAVEHYDTIWRTVPMPLDYTCHCGIYVHPMRRNPAAIHISDCPYAPADSAPAAPSKSVQKRLAVQRGDAETVSAGEVTK